MYFPLKVTSIFILGLCLVLSCNTKSDQKENKGKELAKQYCSVCHLLPDPNLLDVKTWQEFALPKMGLHYGFEYTGFGLYRKGGENINSLKRSNWDEIIQYYTSLAPDKVPKDTSKRKPIIIDSTLFSVSYVSPIKHNPATTLVKIASSEKRIYYADGFYKKIFALNFEGKFLDSINTGLGPSYLKLEKGTKYILTMGVLHPSDEKSGDLSFVEHKSKKILDSLQRPVYAAFGDLNKDGKDDIVVCEFGNNTGSLNWYEQKNNSYIKHVLRALPGAIRAEIFDFNKDGLPDIISLMAQGDESVCIYYNQGDGKFVEKRVLRFPPSYGSNSMELFDFNNDGYMDFITTNGDNGDYPPFMKPYHGIRIFINDGKDNFTQQTFLPMNGVGKALIKDFNNDGQMDIVAISYFPDYDTSPEESFIVWMNKGNQQYLPYSLPQTQNGRWITMDASDINHDGYCDIVLGNANLQLGKIPAELMKKISKETPPIIILRNNKIKNIN